VVAKIRVMGRLLQKAVAEVSKLPEAEQEAFGARLLAELESKRRWDDLFARSQDMLAEMAAEAIREDEAGLTQPLDPDA
jgi:methylase of polypeptide subunit release factors